MKKVLLGLLLSTMVFQTVAVTSASASQAPVSVATKSQSHLQSDPVGVADTMNVDEGDPDMPELEPVTDITAFMSRAGVERAAAGAQNATTKSTVNLRKGPSTSSIILRNLPKGEKLVILGKADSNWYHVQDSQGNMGYLSTASKYTSITGAAKSGHIVSRVNLRTEPSTSSSVIKKLDAGHEVAILKTVNANWLQVWDGQGKVGYISSSSQYIKMGGSGSTTPPSSNAQIEKVISTGMKYLGTPYEFGSNRNSTKTFDCSAFVRQAYKEALGIVLGTDSRKQGEWIKSNSTVKKSISSLKRGDLMFFMSYKGTSASSYSGINKDKERITHVGIYLGDGKILHTYSKASGGVRVDTVKGKHWEYRFLYGGSVLK